MDTDIDTDVSLCVGVDVNIDLVTDLVRNIGTNPSNWTFYCVLIMPQWRNKFKRSPWHHFAC